MRRGEGRGGKQWQALAPFCHGVPSGLARPAHLGGGVVHHLLGGEVALLLPTSSLLTFSAGVAVNLLEPTASTLA